MTENQGTSDFAIKYDVNAFFNVLFTAENNCICSVGSFEDQPTVNLSYCLHLIDTKVKHLCVKEMLNDSFPG